MTDSIQTLQECAQEAEFQVICCRDYLTWLSALARAIQLVHAHGEAEVGEGLSSVAKYLGDQALGVASLAIDEFAQIHEGGAAPQNAEVANRGAGGAA